ncbi:MAG: tRNA (adenosine(37)-N6)-threonylcarbamoyltransferase complex transferase subunit TsaD [Ardenticatenaceae bacterium]
MNNSSIPSSDLTILGVESSCDETAVAIVRNGRDILTNVVASQVALHRKYGGVFPEMASRQHIRAITPVLEEALEKAEVTWQEIDGVAATYGPGLAGSLVVGLNFAKGLALAHELPFIGINHLEGHIYSNWLADASRAEVPVPEFPALILIVSGGHTELLLMQDHGKYELLGRTLDDAAGEAFDKVARMLGLRYPGGPEIQKVSTQGNPQAYKFPRSTPNEYDFSFSGLKTAVLREVKKWKKAALQTNASQEASPSETGSNQNESQSTPELPVADLAASFQQAVVNVLVKRTLKAARAFGVKQVHMGGGVAANGPLRTQMRQTLAAEGIPLFYPPLSLCTDNAAATAGAAYWRLAAGQRSPWSLEVVPNLKLF